MLLATISGTTLIVIIVAIAILLLLVAAFVIILINQKKHNDVLKKIIDDNTAKKIEEEKAVITPIPPVAVDGEIENIDTPVITLPECVDDEKVKLEPEVKEFLDDFNLLNDEDKTEIKDKVKNLAHPKPLSQEDLLLSVLEAALTNKKDIPVDPALLKVNEDKKIKEPSDSDVDAITDNILAALEEKLKNQNVQ